MLPTACYVSPLPQQTQNICTMLAQRQRRWADNLQMLYKWFVFTGTVRERHM